MPDLTIPEKGTCKLTGVIVDETGTPLPLANVVSLKCTLYDRESGNPLGGRTNQDIKNAAGGTLDAAGNFSLTLADADNAILDPTRAFELHEALIEWTYGGGSKPGRQVFRIAVRNLRKVT